MGTLNLLIICLTVFFSILLTTIAVILAFIYNNYGVKKREFAHKKEMEELRLGKLKEQTEIEILKNQLRKDIISEISEKSPEVLSEIKNLTSKVSEAEIKKIIKDKFESTVIEKIKSLEEQIKLVSFQNH